MTDAVVDPIEPAKAVDVIHPAETTDRRPAVNIDFDSINVFARRHAATLAITAILLIGAVLRLNGRDWDQGQYLNPDERFMTMVATRIAWPDSIGEYFDSANSPLNPYNY
jgi:hypothetical protein